MGIKRENLIGLGVLNSNITEYTINKSISVLKTDIKDLDMITISIDSKMKIDEHLNYLNEILNYLNSEKAIYDIVNKYYSDEKVELQYRNELEKIARIFRLKIDILDANNIDINILLEGSIESSGLTQIDMRNKQILNIRYVD